MSRYQYEALDTRGEVLRGDLEAADAAAAARALQAAGRIPLRIEGGGGRLGGALFKGFSKRKRVRPRELAVFTRELASLQHAGLALERSLQVIADAAHDARLRSLAISIQRGVRAGQALSQALQAQGVFSRFYVSMVRAAEAAGALDGGLARLADYEERNKALRDTVISALVYPAVVLGVAGVSLLIILAYVVPQFTQLFADAGRALPLSTQVVLWCSAALRDYGWLLAALGALAACAARMHFATPQGRYRRDALLLRLPAGGELVRRIEMARLSRSLAMLMASGVPLVRALSLAKGAVSNRVLADALERAGAGLEAGRGLAGPLLATGVFPLLGLQMMKVGEETGRLEQMLERVAGLYDREVAAATQRLLALLEPLLIVGLGALIAGIILSLMSAIVGIHDLPL